MRERFHLHYIDGRWTPSASGETLPVINPADGTTVARIPAGAPEDADRAAEAAARAFPAWSALKVEERVRFMSRLRDELTARRELIADLEVDELGSPADYALRKHCDYQISRIDAYVEGALTLARDDRNGLEGRTEGAYVWREPMGVVAAVTPWNYPLGQIIQKIIPALLMGNTVVLKPSTLAPLTAAVLIDAAEAAGFPAGVLNLVQGRGSALGERLTRHPLVDMVSFTGSTEVGRAIARAAAEAPKKTALELGGKSPAIWLPSAPAYTGAVLKLFESIFLNAGQTCTALSRVLVPRSRLNEAHAAMKLGLERFPVGHPLTPGVKVGPLCGERQYEKVKGYIELGLQEGAELLAGKVPESFDAARGCFVEPTIFTNVRPDMRIAQEEIFGPVLCVIPYDTVDEAVEIANGTPYGLSSAVFGPDEEALAVARRIRAGNVFINNAPRDVSAPFGGYKQSGIGRESGVEGLLEFTQTKSVFHRW